MLSMDILRVVGFACVRARLEATFGDVLRRSGRSAGHAGAAVVRVRGPPDLRLAPRAREELALAANAVDAR